MIKFKTTNLEKYTEDLNAVLISCVECSLIDSYLYGFEDGYIAAYETAATCWTSYWTVYISSGDLENETLLHDWFNYESAADKEMAQWERSW